jgi:hypothetical protein
MLVLMWLLGGGLGLVCLGDEIKYTVKFLPELIGTVSAFNSDFYRLNKLKALLYRGCK